MDAYGLTRNLYNYARFATDRNGLDEVVASFAKASPLATEYQLFWLAMIAEEFLRTSPRYGEILMVLYEHPNSTTISRAKVLEVDDKRFGLLEMRETILRSRASGWESWAAAVGVRSMAPDKRNHLLTYFGGGSSLNGLIARCVRQLPKADNQLD
jgi:hypothetical protein